MPGEPAADAIAAFVQQPEFDSASKKISVRRSPEYLLWRYGAGPVNYRALRTADAMAIFRLRSQGRATEVAVVEVLAPDSDAAIAVMRAVRHATGAQQVSAHFSDGSAAVAALRREHMTRVLRRSTLVVMARAGMTPDPTAAAAWALSAGDIERF
jgi:hypothetical protein